MATTLSHLIVKLNANTQGFEREMTRTQRTTDRWAKQVKAAGKIAAGAFVAGGTAALALTTKVAAAADEIDKMSIRSGVARGRLQELKFVTDQLGVGFEGMVGTMEALTRRLPQIESGTSDTAKSFQRLGVNLRGADGQLRDMDALFPDIIRSLSEMENETDRNAIATQIFGRRAFEIVPLLEAGGEEIDRLTERARSLGLVMTDVEIERLVEFHDQVAEAKMQVAALAREFALGLLPAVRSTVTFMQEKVLPGVRAFVGGIQIMAAEIDAFFFSIPARVEKAIGNAMANIAAFFFNLQNKLPQWAKDILGVGKQQEFLIKVAAAGVSMAEAASAELDIIASALEEVRQGIVGGGNAAADNLNRVRQSAEEAGAALAGLGEIKPKIKPVEASAPQPARFGGGPEVAPWIAALMRTQEDLAYFGYELQVRAEQLRDQFTHMGQTGQAALQMAGGAALDLAGKFSPLGVMAMLLEGVMEALAPVIEALERPIQIVGQLIGQSLAPILELLVPIIEMAAKQFARTIMAIGYFIKGLGWIIDKLIGWLTDWGDKLQDFGQTMIDNARAAIDNIDAQEEAAEAAHRLASGLTNAVRGFKVAAYAHGATAVGGGTPAAGGGGGGGGGGGPVSIPVTINTSGDGRETYRNWYEEIDQRTRGAGQSARAFFNSLPAPV